MKLNAFLEHDGSIVNFDVENSNNTLAAVIRSTYQEVDHLEFFQILKPVPAAPKYFIQDRLARLAIGDYLKAVAALTKVSNVFQVPVSEQDEDNIHLVIRGGGPLQLNVFLKNAGTTCTIQVPPNIAVKDLHKYLYKVKINAVYKVKEPSPIPENAAALDISSDTYEELDKSTTIDNAFPAVFSLENIQLVLDESDDANDSSKDRVLYVDEIQAQKDATVRSWNIPFKGDAGKVLRSTIIDFSSRGCVPYTTLVNSSGTGKSRLVDQLGISVVVVYMCFRKDGSTGFPPTDKNLRDWILGVASEAAAQTKAYALVYALLVVTHEKLRDIASRLGDPTKPHIRNYMASEFRRSMVQGQTFDEPNEYRHAFYNEVINQAKKLEAKALETGDDRHLKNAISEASLNMRHFLDPTKSGEDALVVFSFDEYHGLAEEQGANGADRTWSIFSCLGQALELVANRRIFSLFLSTVGKYQELPTSYPVWSRVLKPLPPIVEVGFDMLAKRVGENAVRLADVTTDAFISHLGRPLFGTRYDMGDWSVRAGIVSFAELKLTFGKEPFVSDDAALACLAVRFALEFEPTNVEERLLEISQVARHMRICLAAGPGFQSAVTVFPSEPLLAEAAERALPANRIPQRLADQLRRSNILHCCDRGVLAAMALVMVARDEGVQHRKTASVHDFLVALLAEPSHPPLSEFKPSISASKEQDQKSLAKTFERSLLWFNHFIGVEDNDAVNVTYLWRYLVRGAAVLCRNPQRGINILIPILVDGEGCIGRGNVSAILIQVKTDKIFTREVEDHVFDAMDPFATRIFSTRGEALPVIRMVFALGATCDREERNKTSGVQFLSPTVTSSPPKQSRPLYTSYDIWCAGVHQDTFGVVRKEQVPDYERILTRSPGATAAFHASLLKEDEK